MYLLFSIYPALQLTNFNFVTISRKQNSALLYILLTLQEPIIKIIEKIF